MTSRSMSISLNFGSLQSVVALTVLAFAGCGGGESDTPAQKFEGEPPAGSVVIKKDAPPKSENDMGVRERRAARKKAE